jgi:hypothetical protein
VASLFPRDAQLNLPAQGYSHRLQKRVAAKAVKSSCEGVVNDIETETGVRLGTRQVEQIVYAAAQDFDAFYAQGCSEEVQQQAHAKPMQVLTFDGKGGGDAPRGLAGSAPQEGGGQGAETAQRLCSPGEVAPQTDGDGGGHLSR